MEFLPAAGRPITKNQAITQAITGILMTVMPVDGFNENDQGAMSDCQENSKPAMNSIFVKGGERDET